MDKSRQGIQHEKQYPGYGGRGDVKGASDTMRFVFTGGSRYTTFTFSKDISSHTQCGSLLIKFNMLERHAGYKIASHTHTCRRP